MSNPVRIVGVECVNESVPRYSSAVSLDFMADLVGGRLRADGDYPGHPSGGYVGVQLGRAARMVALADGRKIQVSRARFERVRLAAKNRAGSQ